MTPLVRIETSVDPLWLAHQLGDSLEVDELIDFVLAVDDRAMDMDFTVKLYARLGDIIRKEAGADIDNADWIEG